MNILQKYKGLKNAKDWESGMLKLYENGLAAIYRNNCQFYVFRDSVSKFTGFVNSSGIEIYEGDLLMLDGNQEKGINIVFWDNVDHQWKINSSLFEEHLLGHLLQNYLDNSIIGHIYTHEHLIKSPKKVLPMKKK